MWEVYHLSDVGESEDDKQLKEVLVELYDNIESANKAAEGIEITWPHYIFDVRMHSDI